MIFRPLEIGGVFAIELDRLSDERGYFARTYCQEQFKQHGIDPRIAQCSISYNRHAGTLRGLHYQASPHEETKTVSCLRGSCFDVIVDLRPQSPTYLTWISILLSAENKTAVVMPRGVAHGFQTLENQTELMYQISEPYREELSRGIRWDDPTLTIRWPDCPARIISPKDASLPFVK